jgi:hypothetical protein
MPEAPAKLGVVAAHNSGRDALEAVDEVGHGDLGRVVDDKVDVVGVPVELGQLSAEVGADFPEDRPEVAQVLVVEHRGAVPCDKDQVDVEDEHAVTAMA